MQNYAFETPPNWYALSILSFVIYLTAFNMNFNKKNDEIDRSTRSFSTLDVVVATFKRNYKIDGVDGIELWFPLNLLKLLRWLSEISNVNRIWISSKIKPVFFANMWLTLTNRDHKWSSTARNLPYFRTEIMRVLKKIHKDSSVR